MYYPTPKKQVGKQKNIDCILVIQLPKNKWGNAKILTVLVIELPKYKWGNAKIVLISNPTPKREMGEDKNIDCILVIQLTKTNGET